MSHLEEIDYEGKPSLVNVCVLKGDKIMRTVEGTPSTKNGAELLIMEPGAPLLPGDVLPVERHTKGAVPVQILRFTTMKSVINMRKHLERIEHLMANTKIAATL